MHQLHNGRFLIMSLLSKNTHKAIEAFKDVGSLRNKRAVLAAFVKDLQRVFNRVKKQKAKGMRWRYTSFDDGNSLVHLVGPSMMHKAQLLGWFDINWKCGKPSCRGQGATDDEGADADHYVALFDELESLLCRPHSVVSWATQSFIASHLIAKEPDRSARRKDLVRQITRDLRELCLKTIPDMECVHEVYLIFKDYACGDFEISLQHEGQEVCIIDVLTSDLEISGDSHFDASVFPYEKIKKCLKQYHKEFKKIRKALSVTLAQAE